MSMKPLKTRKVARHSLRKGLLDRVTPKPLKNSAMFCLEALRSAGLAASAAATSCMRSRRKMAGRIPSPMATTATTIASPRRPPVRSPGRAEERPEFMIHRNQGETT